MSEDDKDGKSGTSTKGVEAEVIKVQDLLSKGNLNVPAYQRPYKWQEQHVNQLLDDLIPHCDKYAGDDQSFYRLGTVLLHEHDPEQSNLDAEQIRLNRELGKNVLDVVDGQQRLLTITLIGFLLCQRLNNENPEKGYEFTSSLLTKNFSASVSQANLKHNAAVIQSRLGTLSVDELSNLLNFLKKKCELVVVTLFELSEAFQFFDSQNSRGKALAPHDLLKAFHLREMCSDESQKLACVQAWEARIEQQPAGLPSLQHLMEKYLYPIRCWARGESGLGFDKERIGVFKGISPLWKDQYPWEAMFRQVNQGALPYIPSPGSVPLNAWSSVTNLSAGEAEQEKGKDQLQTFPFQLDQPLINGQRFFEFIQYYSDMWNRLFIAPDKDASETDDTRAYQALKPVMDLLNHPDYEGRNRTGDLFVKALFYCVVMYYYDRFGHAELERVAWHCFRWAYRIRVRLYGVQLSSIDNAAIAENSLFRVIAHARYPAEVLSAYVPPPDRIGASREKIAPILEYFERKKQEQTVKEGKSS